MKELVATLLAHSADLPPAVQAAVAKVPSVSAAPPPAAAGVGQSTAPPPPGDTGGDLPAAPMEQEEDPPATQPGTQDATKRDLTRLVVAQGLHPEKTRRLNPEDPLGR